MAKEKGLPKEAFLSLVDSCISGKIVYQSDIEHIFSVYGDAYERADDGIFFTAVHDDENQSWYVGQDALAHCKKCGRAVNPHTYRCCPYCKTDLG